MSSKALEDLAFDKENFESWVDMTLETKLTDEQWERVKEEIDGRTANYLDEMIYGLVLDYREGKFDE